MRVVLAACLAATVIALSAAAFLDRFAQEPSAAAFTELAVRGQSPSPDLVGNAGSSVAEAVRASNRDMAFRANATEVRRVLANAVR
jgi:hypothetical protein